MKMMLKSRIVQVAISFMVFLLVACGGGGGGSDSQNSSDVPEIDVAINQIETDCSEPGLTKVTVYATVIDQDGVAIVDEAGSLEIDLSENGEIIPAGEYSVEYVYELDVPISVSMVLDNSKSMVDAGAVETTNDAAISFINLLNDLDRAEVIKFAEEPILYQSFTSDKSLLIDAVDREWTGGVGTALYDTLSMALDHIALEEDRKAIVAITDGRDFDSVDNDKNDVIAQAISLDVPIFIVGLGNGIDSTSLSSVAQSTGGHFFTAASASELNQIYNNISDLLVINQYVIKFDSLKIETVNLNLEVGYNNLLGDDAKNFTACP